MVTTASGSLLLVPPHCESYCSSEFAYPVQLSQASLVLGDICKGSSDRKTQGLKVLEQYKLPQWVRIQYGAHYYSLGPEREGTLSEQANGLNKSLNCSWRSTDTALYNVC